MGDDVNNIVHVGIWAHAGPVSYTHLDVYKRQGAAAVAGTVVAGCAALAAPPVSDVLGVVARPQWLRAPRREDRHTPRRQGWMSASPSQGAR